MDLDCCWWRLPIVSGGGNSGNSGNSGGGAPTSRSLFGEPDPALLEHAVAFGMPYHLSRCTGPEDQPSGPTLSDQEQTLLDEINKQRGTLLTQLVALMKGETNAFFLYGPGGIGKSYLVRKAMDYSWKRVKWHTTDVSAKGLFNLLRDFPDHIHVFEDMEKMFKQADCQSVLRAACGGTDASERWVCWEKDGEYHEDPFQFTGGIVIISNDDPRGGSMKMGAIASRFAPQKWDLTDHEIAALIRDIAINGDCDYGYDASTRCEVADFVIEEMHKRPQGTRVDLRTFTEHAMPHFHVWNEGEKDTHWHDVVRAKIKGTPRRDFAVVERERYMRAARDAYAEGSNTEQRVKAWKRRTGLGKSQFYEYHKQAKEAGML